MARYFKNFNNIEYDVLLENKPKIIKNIMQKVGMNQAIKSTRELYIDYSIQDGDTAENLADKMYGSSDYVWVVWLINDICNPYYDWILTSKEVSKLVKKRYDDKDGIHHYEDPDGYIVDEYNQDASPVTNESYEIAENEKKRKIKMLDPKYLTTIEQEIKTLFR